MAVTSEPTAARHEGATDERRKSAKRTRGAVPLMRTVDVGRPGCLRPMPGSGMTGPDPATAYCMLSVGAPGDLTLTTHPENQARPYCVTIGAKPLSSMLWLSKAAAESLVDQLVAALVEGGDPDAPPF